MNKFVAISIVVTFLFGFLLGNYVSVDSSKTTLQPPSRSISSMVEKRVDSLQIQKTDIQCFIEAMIISIYPNTALRLNNCKTAHVDVKENGFKKMVAKDNDKDVLNALTSYLDSDVDLGDFKFLSVCWYINCLLKIKQ